MIPKPSHIIDKVVTVGFVDLLKMFLMVFQDIFERFAKEYILRPRSSMSCMRRTMPFGLHPTRDPECAAIERGYDVINEQSIEWKGIPWQNN